MTWKPITSALLRPARLLPIPIIGAMLAFLPSLHAQQPPAVPQTVEEALHQMSDAAGIIFVGEVTAIRPRAGEDGASGVMEIDFRVDQAVRSCAAGSIYTLREWAGLWAGGDQRYRVGQRLLMLLHAPGPTGITSPVGGMTGAIPVRAATPSPQAASATTASAPLIADLRWVGTRLQRSVPYATPPLATAQNSPAPAVSDTSIAAQQAPVSVVVGMLSSWPQAHP